MSERDAWNCYSFEQRNSLQVNKKIVQSEFKGFPSDFNIQA